MDWSWALQFALAVASVVMDRRDDLTGNSEGSADEIGRSSHRQGRIVAVPPGSPVTIGLIFGVPISILIPVVRKRLADFGREDDQGPEVSTDGENLGDGNGLEFDPAAGLAGPDVSEGRGFASSEPELDIDDLHETQLRKLDDYFGYMEVTSEKCKRRLICEVAAAPEDFYPVSDIILRQVKPKGPVAASRRSRFASFLEAAKLGFNGDIKLCARQLGCQYSGTELFDAKMLRVLQLLGKYLNIEFVDRS